MARRLKTFVHVHQDDGEVHVYGPEDDVPDEDAEKIGDHAWTEDEVEPEQGARIQVDADKPAKKAAPKKAPAGAARATRATPARPAAGGLKPGDKVEASDEDDGK